MTLLTNFGHESRVILYCHISNVGLKNTEVVPKVRRPKLQKKGVGEVAHSGGKSTNARKSVGHNPRHPFPTYSLLA